MYSIENPADKISNPANKIYNPATDIKNPASRMDNPNPLSPPTHTDPATKPADQIKKKVLTRPRLAIPHKSYHFKSVRAYINAAKKAFSQDDYLKFLSVTEDALRRINAGKLSASDKAIQQLEKYKLFGYGLLEMEKE